jgi:hypothetical protein
MSDNSMSGGLRRQVWQVNLLTSNFLLFLAQLGQRDVAAHEVAWLNFGEGWLYRCAQVFYAATSHSWATRV